MTCLISPVFQGKLFAIRQILERPWIKEGLKQELKSKLPLYARVMKRFQMEAIPEQWRAQRAFAKIQTHTH